MCADIFRIGEIITEFENKGIEYLHIDVMDGHFVPNYAIGSDYCRMIRKRTSISLDYHLMTTDPLNDLERFDIREGDIVSIHAESTPHTVLALDRIRKIGAHPFIALNPGTPVNVLEETIHHADGVLIMTVNPGFAGQKLIPHTVEKIARVRSKINNLGYEVPIEVDGNVSFDNAKMMAKAGANIFVAGSSSVFNSSIQLSDAIDMLREAIKRDEQ